MTTTTKEIDVRFTGAGRYWLTDRQRQADIDLGDCADEAEVRKAIAEVIDAGSGEEDWSGWNAAREGMNI